MKLVVITGYLGSGKTTHLRRMLGRRASRVAVIVNEFADAGIDEDLIAPHCVRTIGVTGGCACCDRLVELLDALRSLLDDKQRGKLDLSRVVIETSGLADPLPIVSAVAGDPVLHHHFELEAVIAVVDGIEGQGQLDRHPEVRRQVLGADKVVISKTDLADPAEVEVLRARLDALGSEPGMHSHTEQVASVSIEFATALDWAAFSVWLSLLVHAHGPRLLRIKGIVPVDGLGAIAVNAVQQTLFPPEHVVGQPGPARLAVIAQGLDGVAIRRSVFAFQAAA